MVGMSELNQPLSAIVTGTGGLGLEVAVGLVRLGTEVVIAGRNAAAGAAALARVRREVPEARVGFEPLDLADLASVAAFAERMRGTRARLDLLVNNAGVMTPPRRLVTRDGFELQLGTNHLGHFALTAGLMPLLRAAAAPRVVSVSSLAHNRGRIRFDDLQWQRSYWAWVAYSQSKLAVLMFALELQRRSDAAGWGIASIAAHPGLTRTNLFASGPGWTPFGIATRLTVRLMGQRPARGALPILFAATSPEARGGAYYGPGGLFEFTGTPKPARMTAYARDAAVAKRLWDVSEELTGVRF